VNGISPINHLSSFFEGESLSPKAGFRHYGAAHINSQTNRHILRETKTLKVIRRTQTSSLEILFCFEEVYKAKRREAHYIEDASYFESR